MIRSSNTILLCFACNLALTTGQAFGQFTTVLNIPPNPNIVGDFQSIGSNTQLNLFDGGSIIGQNFSAGARDGTSTNVETNIYGGSVANGFLAIHSTANISGGTVGINFAIGSSTVNVSGGSIQNFSADTNSLVNISGGLVGNFDVRDGTTVNITGGTIGDHSIARATSTINISGGQVGTLTAGGGAGNGSPILGGGTVNVVSGAVVKGITGETGSLINITGGNVGVVGRNAGGSSGYSPLEVYARLNISGGAIGGRFLVGAGSTTTISGSEFRLDGVLLSGLESPGNALAFNVPTGSTLSGTLSDGTPFAFSSLEGDSIADGTLTLKAAALPAIGPATITIHDAQAPLGVRGGQTLIVQSGGVLAENFNAGRGSTVQINGGQIGNNFEAVAANVSISNGTVGGFFDAYAGSTVLVSGGTVGSDFDAFDHSVVNISGGAVGDFFTAYSGSTVNLSRGSIGQSLTANSHSTINISGGSIGTNFQAKGGSLINMSGGTIGVGFVAQSGSTVNVTGGSFGGTYLAAAGSLTTISGGTIPTNVSAAATSEIDLWGTKFILDGIDITNSLSAGVPFIVTKRDVPFSGLLADGSPFTISLLSSSRTGPTFSPGATLKLILVPEPETWLLASLLMLVVPMPIRRGRQCVRRALKRTKGGRNQWYFLVPDIFHPLTATSVTAIRLLD